MSDRCGPSSNRHNPRNRSRYEPSSDDGHSAAYSEGDGGGGIGVSYLPGNTATSRRPSSLRSDRHPHPDHHSRPSHRSHSKRHHQRSHRHHRQKLLGPAGGCENPRDGPSTALAVREEYQVQAVPRAHRAGWSDDEEVEEVYDHRPRPLSHRGRSHAGVSDRQSGRARGQQAGDADRGFFVAAAVLAVSFIICCGDADND